MTSDRSRCTEGWDADTTDKVSHWGSTDGRSLGVDNPLMRNDSSCNKGNKNDKDTDSKETGNSDTGNDDDPVVDSSSKPGEKDPEPEGGDPDELLARGKIQDVMFAQDAARGATGQNGSGLPDRTTKGKRGLQPWAPEPLVEPRVPGPDENAGSASSAIRADLLNNANAYPTPDNPDGPTDPRASAGTTLNRNLHNAMSGGVTASPVDGGQGSPTPPPSDPR
jgi:hypothetical protein